MTSQKKRTRSESLRELLRKLARAHSILEMEGHGDMTLGHMSVRDPKGRGFWLKKRGIGLGEVIGTDDFILLDFDGNPLSGKGGRHSEWPIHAQIMMVRKDINSVAHTHPFHASVFSSTNEPLRPVGLEGSYFGGKVPHYKETSGLVHTPEHGRNLASVLGDTYGVFMKNHGVTFCGESIEHATLMGIFLERACRSQLMISASGLNWSWPDEAELSEKAPMIMSPLHIEESWAYYNRKLDWFLSTGRSRGKRFFR